MNVRRIVGRIAAGLLILVVVAVVGAYFFLKTTSFQRFAIRKIVEQADRATGGKTAIGGLDLELKQLTARLYNITLRGTESSAGPPLLRADELTVRIEIESLFHPKVSIRELAIYHPVVHIQVSRAGKNNVPTPPPSNSNNHTSVFDLGVGHARISNGEIDYNDHKTPVEADLYDLGTDIHFHSPDKRYDGNLSYRNGRLRYAQYAPLAHNLSLEFTATPDHFEVRSLTMNLGSSVVNLAARLTNYAAPVADADYRLRIHTEDFRTMSGSVSPKGDVFLDGKIHYQAAGNEPFLRTLSVDGRLASEALLAAASGRRVEVRNLQAGYVLRNGNLEVPTLSANVFGGTVTAEARVTHLDSTPEASIRSSLDKISLRAIQNIAGPQALPTVSVSGTLSGKAEASWKEAISNLRVHSDLSLRAEAKHKPTPAAPEVPITGSLHASYDGPRQLIEVRDTSFRIPSATLVAEGSISNYSNLEVQVRANDLHQLVALAYSFSSSGSPPPAISGSAAMNVTVRGSMKQPEIAGQLMIQNLDVEGSQWSSARVSMHANPSQFVIDTASLANAHQGRATLSASVGLNKWAYEPANAFEAHLEAERLRLTDLQHLAKQHYPVSGDLSAKVNLSGSQLQPVGSGSATIANAHAFGEPVRNFAAQFRAANGTVASKLNISSAAGSVAANLSYVPETKAYSVELEAPSIVLEKLRTVEAKNLGVKGTISASVNGQGTVDNPELAATVEMPLLDIQQTTVSGFKADLRVAQHRADFNLDTKVSAASIRAHGKVNLTGDYDTEAVIDTGTIPLAAILATYAPGVPQGFQGQTELHATLKGPLKQKSKVEAHVSIPVFEAKYQQLEIGIPRPIRVDFAHSVLTLQPTELRGTDTSLRAQGQIPIGVSAPATLTVQGSIDMQIVRILAPTVESSGVVAVDVRSSGALAKPEIQGKVELKDVAMSTADAPLGVSRLNGTLNIDKDHANIVTMTAQVGGGQVSIGGSVAYRPALEFNLAVQGKSVRLLYPQGLRTLLDMNLSFIGTTKASTVSGRVLIDNLSFTPDFDLPAFGNQFSEINVPSQPGFADTVKLGVAVQSPSTLNAVSAQVSIAGQVALQVGGTAANPVITGRTTLNSGEVFFLNVRYELQRGVITFDDPNQTHPVLNVTATTTVQQYNLTLTLRGPLDKLTTSYVSDPPLATADIINLVARGKTTEQGTATTQSTDSMIATQVAGQLSSGVQKLAGLSSLQIDPTLGGSNSNPSARIGFQQRVTKNFLFSFSTDVTEPGSEIIQGEYQINKRWSVSVQRDQLGGISVDGRYRTRF